MNGAVDYLRDGFEKCGVKVDTNSSKVIQYPFIMLRVPAAFGLMELIFN